MLGRAVGVYVCRTPNLDRWRLASGEHGRGARKTARWKRASNDARGGQVTCNIARAFRHVTLTCATNFTAVADSLANYSTMPKNTLYVTGFTKETKAADLAPDFEKYVIFLPGRRFAAPANPPDSARSSALTSQLHAQTTVKNTPS